MTNVLDDELYGVRPVANFFSKTVQWLRWAEAHGRFTREDGTQIIPRRTAPPHAVAGYRRYTLADVVEMAASLHRNHDLSVDDYQEVLDRVAREELALEHGLSWSEVNEMSDLVVEIKLQESGRSIEGTSDEKRKRLWESTQPIYPLPKLITNSAREIVFSAVLDENGEPRPHGALRSAILERLKTLGYRDELTANQTIDIQLENLVKFYGFTIVSTGPEIIVARRH